MLKFDDQFPLHRKVAGLSDGAFRLHVEAIFWARRNLTDGFVPSADLATVSARFARSARLADECVQRGTWHRVEEGRVECTECAARHNGSLAGDGWVIHGYADWNETRSKVLHVRSVRAAAGRDGGIASGRSRRKREATPKQVARAALPNERTPRPPRPPSGGSGRARPRGAVPSTPQHEYQHDDQCGVCADCSMPEANAVHRSTPRAAA